jgi:hypothetical protein
MQLADYMQAEGLDDAAFAAKINRSRVSVGRYRRKLEIPSGSTVKLIVEASNGRVSANELLEITAPEAAE